jgi:hypothetical protein
VLWIGSGIAAAGLDWVPAAQRDALRARLAAAGREVLWLRDAQLRAFAGNMLELADASRRRLVMSSTAAASLDADQQRSLQRSGVVPVIGNIPTIERIGGGSVRCMLAEVPAPVERSP